MKIGHYIIDEWIHITNYLSYRRVIDLTLPNDVNTCLNFDEDGESSISVYPYEAGCYMIYFGDCSSLEMDYISIYKNEFFFSKENAISRVEEFLKKLSKLKAFL